MDGVDEVAHLRFRGHLRDLDVGVGEQQAEQFAARIARTAHDGHA